MRRRRGPRRRARSYSGLTSTRTLLAATAILLAACGSASPAPVPRTWTPVKGLGHVVSAAAPTASAPWLLGGDVMTAAGINHVAIWSAVSPAGPWRPASFDPVPGRDGPNETILGFAGRTAPEVALGSRRSPTEGYPRPSTWFASDGTGGLLWHEVLADRELFGGPNVVATGGLASGPHGYHIAGTWIGPGDGVVAAVWSSRDGRDWARDDSDPAFTAGAATESFAYDVADGPSGLLLAGTTALPVSGDPTRQVGSLWYSATGSRWKRLAPLSGGDQTVVTAVQPLGAGWLAGGHGGPEPTVWTIDSERRVTATILTTPPGTTSAVDDVAVTPAAVLASGVTTSGAPILWMASRHGAQLGAWRLMTVPPAGVEWSQARLAVGSDQILLVVFGPDRSEVWRAALASS